MNCGPDCDKATAKSPQTGDPLARISRDLGVMRILSNLHSDKNLQCQHYYNYCTSKKKREKEKWIKSLNEKKGKVQK